MESRPQNLNLGLILKTFTHVYGLTHEISVPGFICFIKWASLRQNQSSKKVRFIPACLATETG